MNISSSKKEIYKKAENVFGSTAQILVAIEECGEFQHAAARFLNGRENNIVEEAVHVLIMMEQIITILNVEDLANEIELTVFRRIIDKMSSFVGANK